MTIIYKNKEYNVVNPGILELTIDQLSGNKMPVRFSKYIRKTYNITDEDYYIIVVFKGDISLVPKCKKEGCLCNCRFLGLRAGYSNGCCTSHSHSYSNKIRITNGTHNFLEIDRSSVVRNMIENGTHPWLSKNSEGMRERNYQKQIERGTFKLSDKDVIDKRNESIRNIPKEVRSEISSKVAKERVKNGTHPWLKGGNNDASKRMKNLAESGRHPWQKKTNRVKSHYKSFISKGNLDDVCSLYITELESDPSIIKIGASHDVDRRSGFHGNCGYKNLQVLKVSDRLSIGDLEMKIKNHFIDNSIGSSVEIFPIELRNDIINFINKL